MASDVSESQRQLVAVTNSLRDDGQAFSIAFCNTICIYIVRFEWDEAKNWQNQRKHEGISFELATLVFEDEHCLVGLDRMDDAGEQRWHAIGMARMEPDMELVLLVVHAYREDRDDEEIIRIISARRAEKRELRRYQEQAME